MENLIVFLIVAVAAGYVIRRFFFKKGNGCGCGCEGGCNGTSAGPAKDACGCCPSESGRP